MIKKKILNWGYQADKQSHDHINSISSKQIKRITKGSGNEKPMQRKFNKQQVQQHYKNSSAWKNNIQTKQIWTHETKILKKMLPLDIYKHTRLYQLLQLFLHNFFLHNNFNKKFTVFYFFTILVLYFSMNCILKLNFCYSLSYTIINW